MDEDPVKFKLEDIQQTLVLPLWARAKEAEKADPILNDAIAKELISLIDFDFSLIEANKEFAENQQLQWALRAYQFDKKINEFVHLHDRAAVINIGAGLDTTFQRVDNGNIQWINIDLPEVALLREKIIPDKERERTVARSVFDFSWIKDVEEVTSARKIFIMAAGVFFYFTAAEMKLLLSELARAYPGAELTFDILSSRIWVRLTNRAIMRQSGMSPSVRLRWHLRKAATLKQWVPTVQVLDEYSMFSRIPIKEEWSKKLVRDMKIGNFFNVYKLVHLQL